MLLARLYLKGRKERERNKCATRRLDQIPSLVCFQVQRLPAVPSLQVRLGAGSSSSSSFCLSVKQMGFLLTPEYCERAGRDQATSSFPPSYPLYIFVRVCLGRAVVPACAAVGRPRWPVTPPRGGEAGPEPARSLAPPLRGGEGKEEGGREGERESRQKEAAGAPRGGGETGSAGAGRSPAAAGGVRRGSRFHSGRSPHLRARTSLPGPEGAGAGRRVLADWAPGPAARPPSPGCASAPRPWLRAGGGRTRRKSCASAASSGARAAPGAVRSRATRPQIATNEINQSIVLQAKDPCHPLEQ